MTPVPDELRLAFLLGLTALAAGAAAYAAPRGGERNARAADVLLLFHLLQYAAVGVAGLCGVLSAASVAVVLALACAGLWALRRRAEPHGTPVSPPIENGRGRFAPMARAAPALVLLFVAAYVAAFEYEQRHLPVLATDALTYHLPAAVRWLQTGRLARWPTWFFNPANTYSPLGGSIFLAWWIAPLGHDALVPAAQVPALLLLFFSVAAIARQLGATPVPAALVGAAAALSRPFFADAVASAGKDDVLLSAFFAAAVAALAPGRLRERAAGPLRLGAAIGLMLSIKYTALLALPALLLAADAPRRAGWRPRQYAAALLAAAAVAGPWYARNLWQFGNPLFPLDVRWAGVRLLRGTVRSAPAVAAWAGPGGLWPALAGGYYGVPVLLGTAVVLLWLARSLVAGRAALADPVRRVVLGGPIVCLLLFRFASPYAEARFLYPPLALLFAGAAGRTDGADARRRPWQAGAGLIAAAGLLCVAIVTQFDGSRLGNICVLAFQAALIAFATFTLYRLACARRTPRLARATLAILVPLVAAGYAYVNWAAYLIGCRVGADEARGMTYGPLADVWAAVEEQVPPDAAVAYAGTPMAYPLFGFDLARSVVYVPLRANLNAPGDLDLTVRPLRGPQIDAAATAATEADPEETLWLRRLTEARVQYLVVVRGEELPVPAELAFAQRHPDRFHAIFIGPRGAVFEVR